MTYDAETVAAEVANLFGRTLQSLTVLDTEDVNGWGVISGYEMTLDSGQEHLLYLAPLPTSNRIHLETQATLTFTDAETGTTTLAWLYPNDPALPALPHCVTIAGAEQILRTLDYPEQNTQTRPLAAIELVGYRPGKRAVLRATYEEIATGQNRTKTDEHSPTVVYLKVVPPSTAKPLAARHRALRDAHIPVPEVLAWSPSGLLILRAITGHTLSARDLDAVTLSQVMDQTLNALSHIPAPETQNTKTPVAQASAQYVQSIEQYSPSLGSTAHRLSEAISEWMAQQDTGCVDLLPIHGDLHSEQIFVDDEGQLTGILDMERLGLGTVEDDLAVFVAHEFVRLALFDLTADQAHAAKLRIAAAQANAQMQYLRPRIAAVLIAHAATYAVAQNKQAVTALLDLAEHELEAAHVG